MITPPHSGALSQLVRWMLFSRPCFGEAAGLTTAQAARESLLKEAKPMLARDRLSAMGAVRPKNETLLGAFTIVTCLLSAVAQATGGAQFLWYSDAKIRRRGVV